MMMSVVHSSSGMVIDAMFEELTLPPPTKVSKIERYG